MLLAVDVGNSNISIALFDREGSLRFRASLDTDRRKTADQICVDLMNLFQLYHFRYQEVSDSILCSVVPPLNFMMEKALTRLLGKPPMVVGPGVKTGLNIRLAVQTQMGADIVADAVAALEIFQAPIITIDMGTATTIGVISEGRTYEGGMLLPGVNVSLEAPEPPDSPAAGHLPSGTQNADRKDHGGVHAFRHRLRYRRHAGWPDRPHPGGISGKDGEHRGHRRQRPLYREILPQQNSLRQYTADEGPVGHLQAESVKNAA